MLASMLLACVSSTLQPPPVEDGSAAASMAARPGWSESDGYAPGLALSQVEGFSTEAHSGPLEGALLRCAVQTSHRGDRARWLAARRGIDTSLPDIDGRIYTDELGVRTRGRDNSAEATLAAPSMRLEPGDDLQIVLSDRGLIRQFTFDTLHGTYDGVLPMRLTGAKSEATCGRVPAAEVEAALGVALVEADAGLARLAARTVALEAADFGRALEPDPRAGLYPAAGLVGWSHPEVRARVSQVEQSEAAFKAQIAAAVRSEVAGLPQAVTVDGAELSVRRAVCPWPLGYWRYQMEAECVVELRVSVGEAPLPDMTLVFADGAHWRAYPWSVPENAHALTEASPGGLEPGASGLVLIRYLRGDAPIALRVEGAEGVRWLPLEDGSAAGGVQEARVGG